MKNHLSDDQSPQPPSSTTSTSSPPTTANPRYYTPNTSDSVFSPSSSSISSSISSSTPIPLTPDLKSQPRTLSSSTRFQSAARTPSTPFSPDDMDLSLMSISNNNNTFNHSMTMTSVNETTEYNKPIHLFYDESLSTTHEPPILGREEFELPERVKIIYDRLKKIPSFDTLFSPFSISDSNGFTDAIISSVHSKEYIDVVSSIADLSPSQHRSMEAKFDNDLYISSTSYEAAVKSCSGVVECVRRVMVGRESSSDGGSSGSGRVEGEGKERGSNLAIAVVRPPGHHACTDKAMGFCFLNNVAIAAKYAIAEKLAQKVLVIDWDIHHGNGTQDITYDDKDIVYLSLHRYGGLGSTFFYPGTGQANELGAESCKGSNINIAWTSKHMGNTEYIAAWSEVVLPIIKALSPQLIIISSGFDAAQGDPIGDCRLTPECYYLMTKSILTVVDNEDVGVVVALEGGYNLEIIPLCMEAVAIALTGEEWDEEGVGPVIGRFALDSNSLTRARIQLTKYWDYFESAGKRGKKMSLSGAKCINRTIKALSCCERWKECNFHTRKIVEQAVERTTQTRGNSNKQMAKVEEMKKEKESTKINAGRGSLFAADQEEKAETSLSSSLEAEVGAGLKGNEAKVKAWGDERLEMNNLFLSLSTATTATTAATTTTTTEMTEETETTKIQK